MAAESLVIEDMVRMRELRELLDLQEEAEGNEQQTSASSSSSGLRCLAWISCITLDPRRYVDETPSQRGALNSHEVFERNHQAWIELQNFIADLRAISPRGESSFFCKFKQLVSIYTTIRYPNFVAVIQPKLHLINTIEA